MMKSDLEMNTEFRIKWRGEMGTADSEQFMLIEHLAEEIEKLTAEIESDEHHLTNNRNFKLSS